jgi:uncharacterized repeat protein (TIGR01451 family)/fimbrial isopeptide formation D2 family protein
MRLILAFLAVLSSVVLIPGAPKAEAASDDLTIQASVDSSSIAAGAVSNWTLTVDTSADVTLAGGIVVTDTVPDGLCPYGAGDADCGGGVAPAPSYDAATENPDGSWTLVWYLPDMIASSQTTITYSTVARSHYQEAFADDTPVLARDSWVNSAQVTGDVDGLSAIDVSTVGQTAAGVTLVAEIATRPPSLSQPEVCGDGATLTWNDGSATGYRIGDQVCWRLSIGYPVDLVTAGSVVSFNVPGGQAYTSFDTWAIGANNSVPVGDVDGAAVLAGATSLTFTIGDIDGYVAPGDHLELVFSTTIVNPAATTSGQNVTGLAGHEHRTTSGHSINTSDTAISQVLEAEIDLTKGVTAINGVSTGGSVDGAAVSESDVVTYQLSVVNSGDVDAADVIVWDLLPSLLGVCTSQIGAISGGGVCVDASDRLEWTGPDALAVAAGTTATVTYEATVPSGISPETTLGNHAGVVSYTSSTNNSTFTYIPSSNVDPGAGTANTASADDASNVKTPSASITSTRSTGVSETGNNAPSQATIGELITYTVTLVIPEGTTVWDARVTDDLPANLDLVSSNHVFDGEEALVRAEDTATDAVTVDFPAPFYRNAPGTGDDTLTLTIVARVIDVPANSRGTSIGNSANFTWLDQDATGHTKSASVTTTVVEPMLGIAKTSVDSIGDNAVVIGNEVVDYTITVTNPGTANVSTAHELVIVDTLPEGVTLTLPVPDGGVWEADPTPGDGIAGTITWSATSLAAGSSLVRAYRVTVDDPVVVNTTFVNNVAVTGSSMDGTPAVERSAGTGYHAAAGHILSTPLAGISRDLSPDRATIGDVVVNTLYLTMPAGTIMYDVTVIDAVPAGMVFDGMVSSSCDMEGAPCDPAIDVTEIGLVGTNTAAFFLGDIDMSSTTGEARVVSIDYEVHLIDSGSAGNTRVSSAKIYGNQTDRIAGTPGTPPLPSSFDVSVGPANDTVTVVEPGMSIDKDVAGQIGDADSRRAVPGETLTYTIVATNSATTYTSAAHDIVVIDTLPEGLIVTLPIADDGVWAPDGTPGDGVGGTITWTDPGPVAPGSSLLWSYEVAVDPALDSGDEDTGDREAVNTADITSYFGVSAADRVAHPTFTYRDYDNVPADTVQVEFDLASIGGTVWFDVDADGLREAGEPPFAGVDLAVTYLGPDGVVSGDDENHPATTASDGSALVESLPGGNYRVVVDAADLPGGFVPSSDLDGGTLTPDGAWGPGPLAENEDKLNVDFGYTGTGSVGGTVWFDSDGDQSIGGGEYGLEGVHLTLVWLGVDGINSGDDVTYLLTTSADGSYLVPRLPAGDYTVTIDDASLPAGMNPTCDPDGSATPGTAAINLSSAGNELTQDFGYAGSGTIGDLVWLDRNGDGFRDPTEPGITGVPVELTWPGEDGVLGGGNDELFLDTTDGDGLYTFANVPPGEYQVTILGGLPTAAPGTFDEDGGNDATTVVDLGDGETHLTADFGFHGTASIGDMVWWDIDGDGSLDAGEPGIAGVDISLRYAGLDGVPGNGDDLAFTMTTGSSGGFLFADLPAGDYQVTLVGGIPAGMTQTYDETGGLDVTSLVAGLAVDEIHLTADFGFVGTGSIGDFVWLDLDGNGIQDALEPGLPAVTVAVTWSGVDGLLPSADDYTLVTATDIDGNYVVADLPAGAYAVAVDPTSLPSGVAVTYDSDGVSTPNQSSMILGGGADDISQDFGYDGGGVVGDMVWFDRDGDGARGTDEYGVAGVTVDVTWAGPDGIHATADDETFTRITEADGGYQLSNLPRGGYAVVVDTASLPPGMTAASDEDGVLDDQTLFTLGEGEVHRGADFGYYGTGWIGDLVWLDRDGDGSVGIDEPGIPDQEIELTAAGADAVLGTADDEDYVAVTGPDGGYVFANLPPGDYAVAVTGGIVTSAGNTSDEDGDLDSYVDVALGDGIGHGITDFGYRGSGQIGDLVWLDLDADGNTDPAEPGLPGVEVTVTWLGGDGTAGGGDDLPVLVTSTDAAGTYLAAGLPSGSHEVAVTGGVPVGLGNSADADGGGDGTTIVLVADGEVHEDVDFGYAGEGLIGDTIWWDLDADGTQSTREPGITGIEVALTWAGLDAEMATGDDSTWHTTTDSNGTYFFSDLPPGLYEVSVDASGLPPGVAPSADPDVVPDGTAVVTLDPYSSDVDQDFGFRGDGTVSGSIWIDVDNDGARSAHEPGVGGGVVAVAYLGPDEPIGTDVTFTVLTGATGEYSVPGLPSGFFEVELDTTTLPAGIEPGDGVATVLSLTVGAAATVPDIGFRTVGTGTLRGLTWNDLDGNQLPDAAEVGLAGVGISVVWEPPSGDVVLAAESDAFGNWELKHLPPGLYGTAIDRLSLPIGMSPTTSAGVPVVLDPSGLETADFGVALFVDVGSRVWVDENGNRTADAGEPGIANVLVNLYDEIGGLVAITETDPNGSYHFATLYPGQYSVHLDDRSIPGSLRPSWDRDGVADLETAIDLTGGVHVLDADFGFQAGLPLTGFDVDVLALWGALLTFFGVGFVLAANVATRERSLIVSSPATT